VVQFFRDNFKQRLRFELPFFNHYFLNIVLVLDYEVVTSNIRHSCGDIQFEFVGTRPQILIKECTDDIHP
jgi:hypothetical protein